MNVRRDILQLLREAQAFSTSVSEHDAVLWLEALARTRESIKKFGEFPLRPAQERAWQIFADARVGLLLGPPGTSKTELLSRFAVGFAAVRRAAGLPCRVLVTAFTRNAAGN